MFFDKKNNKTIRIIWMVLGILVIVSMIILYFPALSIQ